MSLEHSRTDRKTRRKLSRLQTPTRELEPLLDRCETAEMLGLEPRTLTQWHSIGRFSDLLPVVKVGRKAMYRAVDVERFIESRVENRAGALKRKEG